MFTGFVIITTSCQTTVSVIYIFPFVPDSFLMLYLDRASQAFLWYSQFFSESELRLEDFKPIQTNFFSFDNSMSRIFYLTHLTEFISMMTYTEKPQI